jgi:hypothetical protein
VHPPRFNTNYVEARNQKPLILSKFVGYICSVLQAKNEMLHEDDKIMKTNIYVQHTWASPKFSQAKNENMKEHPKYLLVTLSLREGMTCMNVLNNKETSMLYMLRGVVACHNIIHFDVIVHFTQHFEVDHTID